MSETSHTTDDNYLSSLKGAEWFVIASVEALLAAKEARAA